MRAAWNCSERSPVWREYSQALAQHLAGPAEVLRLTPTSRSLIQV